MKRKGHYSRLYEKKGWQWRLHFFEPSVLDHVKEDPNYNFYGNKFYTKPEASIEPSGIQQFMWGYKADGNPCIAALLPHLMTLSYKDQLFGNRKN